MTESSVKLQTPEFIRKLLHEAIRLSPAFSALDLAFYEQTGLDSERTLGSIQGKVERAIADLGVLPLITRSTVTKLWSVVLTDEGFGESLKIAILEAYVLHLQWMEEIAA